jgi:hypothetical protein
MTDTAAAVEAAGAAWELAVDGSDEKRDAFFAHHAAIKAHQLAVAAATKGTKGKAAKGLRGLAVHAVGSKSWTEY